MRLPSAAISRWKRISAGAKRRPCAHACNRSCAAAAGQHLAGTNRSARPQQFRSRAANLTRAAGCNRAVRQSDCSNNAPACAKAEKAGVLQTSRQFLQEDVWRGMNGVTKQSKASASFPAPPPPPQTCHCIRESEQRTQNRLPYPDVFGSHFDMPARLLNSA